MTVAVRYRCPRCGTVVSMERGAYLADRSVTPHPLEGWSYAPPEGDAESADGVRFVCGESAGLDWEGPGCGEPFYLSFVRFEAGEEVEPVPEPDRVTIGKPGPRRPPGSSGPPGPG